MAPGKNLNDLLENSRIGDHMTTNILVGKEEFSMSHITRLFNELKIHHLPIVDDDNRVTGIISANDLLRSFSMVLELGEVSLSEEFESGGTVRDYITRNIEVCSPGDPIITAIEKFDKGNFHALPVVENEELVGIFTSRDLIRFISDQKQA